MSSENTVYVIGSLRNPNVPVVADSLRSMGTFVFDDWHAAGPDADTYWREYEQARGFRYREALNGPVANHNFDFDKKWLDFCNVGVLVLPAGKSGHMELGYMKGRGARCFVLMDEDPETGWDLMYKLADAVCYNVEELKAAIGQEV